MVLEQSQDNNWNWKVAFIELEMAFDMVLGVAVWLQEKSRDWLEKQNIYIQVPQISIYWNWNNWMQERGEKTEK